MLNLSVQINRITASQYYAQPLHMPARLTGALNVRSQQVEPTIEPTKPTHHRMDPKTMVPDHQLSKSNLQLKSFNQGQPFTRMIWLLIKHLQTLRSKGHSSALRHHQYHVQGGTGWEPHAFLQLRLAEHLSWGLSSGTLQCMEGQARCRDHNMPQMSYIATSADGKLRANTYKTRTAI